MSSGSIDCAIRAALEAHAGQLRKGPAAEPYAIHPVHVALMLANWGATDVVVQAGLLHDVVEDCDGWDLDRINAEFGAEVAGVVGELTEDKSLPWAERKRLGIEGVGGLSPEALLVKSADKLHNLRCLAMDLDAEKNPDVIWSSFNGGREGTLSVAEAFVEALARRAPSEVGAALRHVLDKLQRVSSSTSGGSQADN